jgi:hypothetical protein
MCKLFYYCVFIVFIILFAQECDGKLAHSKQRPNCYFRSNRFEQNLFVESLGRNQSREKLQVVIIFCCVVVSLQYIVSLLGCFCVSLENILFCLYNTLFISHFFVCFSYSLDVLFCLSFVNILL